MSTTSLIRLMSDITLIRLAPWSNTTHISACPKREISLPLHGGLTDFPPTRIKVSQYLNLPDVQALLGVDKHQGTWVETGRDVARSFSAAHDLTHQTWFYVANLLERGVKVLNVSPCGGPLSPTTSHLHLICMISSP